ncbi:reverse transcriptase-like protein [Brevibacillus sp. NRS-1366]|uniref:reverse transcriptase-like protein n=1 Tax=Brevibacillus sp. NRS-1366 TaxID=3233899 RepID=UPI003D239850
MHKAYFDASVDWAKKQITTAFIIYDRNGNVLYQEAKNIGNNINKYDNNYAEWFALNQLLKTLRRFQINEVAIYGDNQSVIAIANGLSKKERNKELHRIIWKYGEKFKQITFNWISRKNNKEADKLSRIKENVITLDQAKKIRVCASRKEIKNNKQNNANTYAVLPHKFDFNFQYKERRKKVMTR